ncbi:MAG: septum formation inhibitor Maf [Cycloclasticus sp.]|nr:MAG: septum formation inhibitor Maf [Cycloclasticus sp.]
MKNQHKLVLASSSPFRKELLKKLVSDFDAASPDIDESFKPNESPFQLSKRLAYEKANTLSSQFPHHLIIGSDQVAMLDDKQLTKPGSHENCVHQLSLSSGKVITFYTSICVLNSQTGESIVELDVCHVHMKHLSLEQIETYASLDKPYNCAAAFKSEGLGIALVAKIDGEDPNALVGLPLIKLTNILSEMGVEIL